MNDELYRRLVAVWTTLDGFHRKRLFADDNPGCKDLCLNTGPDALRLGFTVGLADERTDRANADLMVHALPDLWAIYNELSGWTPAAEAAEANARRERWHASSPLPWAAKLEDDLALFDADGEQLFIFNDVHDTGWANAFVIATVYVPQLLGGAVAR